MKVTEVSNQFLLYGIHFVYDEMSRPYSRTYSGRPSRNGDTRVIVSRDNAQHLEFFMNGSWRHNQERCRKHTNKECNMR
jgi:hypothetical protein